MKALVCTEPGLLEFKNIKEPALQPGHALLKINKIGICGTDLHAFEGTQPYFNYPRILGHELSAELVDFENAPGFKKGEFVTIIPYFHCGHCIACRSGKPNCCVQIQVSGVHVDGGMRELYSVPSYSLVHGQGLKSAELALVEPLAIGAHGIRRAGITPGEFVLVMGAGPIGLGTMEFAKLAGGIVIALDYSENRLSFCRDSLHIPYIIDAGSDDIEGQLLSITHGDMPTVVIDATGNLAAINKGLYYLAHGGRYLLIGLQKGEIILSHPEFHKRETTLMSSRNATREDFNQVIDCITKGKINPLKLITHFMSFDTLDHQFKSLLDPASHVIKALVEI